MLAFRLPSIQLVQAVAVGGNARVEVTRSSQRRAVQPIHSRPVRRIDSQVSASVRASLQTPAFTASAIGPASPCPARKRAIDARTGSVEGSGSLALFRAAAWARAGQE